MIWYFTCAWFSAYNDITGKKLRKNQVLTMSSLSSLRPYIFKQPSQTNLLLRVKILFWIRISILYFGTVFFEMSRTCDMFSLWYSHLHLLSHCFNFRDFRVNMTGNYVKTDVISYSSTNNTKFWSNLQTSFFSLIIPKAKRSLWNKLVLFPILEIFAVNWSFLYRKLLPM